MEKQISDIQNMLECDQHNVEVTIEILNNYGIYEWIEFTIGLFDEILPNAQQFMSNEFPFFRTDQNGNSEMTFDFKLRFDFTLSAKQQFLYGIGHLLRGQVIEFAHHSWRAIEGAGIAYLSKSKPEIGDYYVKDDRTNFKKETSSNKILPLDNPLTSALNKDFDFLNQLRHNNFISFASRITTSVDFEKTKWTFLQEMNLYEPDLKHILRVSLRLLLIMERVLRLLAASFNIPQHSNFSNKLIQLEQQRRKLYLDLDYLINPNYDE